MNELFARLVGAANTRRKRRADGRLRLTSRIGDDQREISGREVADPSVAHERVTMSILEVASRDRVPDRPGTRPAVIARVGSGQREIPGLSGLNQSAAIDGRQGIVADVRIDTSRRAPSGSDIGRRTAGSGRIGTPEGDRAPAGLRGSA